VQQTNALLDTLFTGAPLGIGFWDRNLRFQRVNHALAAINGIPEEAHIGKTLAELVPGSDPGIAQALSRVIETGEPTTGQAVIGDRLWSVSYYPVRIADEVAGAGAIWDEITERARAENELAAALERARLARADAETEERRSEFLAGAATVLASSLDYRKTLSSVADLAVPCMADWASIDILDYQGRLERLGAAHLDPEKLRLAQEMYDNYPPRRSEPVWRVIESGEPELTAHISPELFESIAQSPEHLRVLRSLGPVSSLVVPIRRDGCSLGAISLVSAESGRTFGAADLRVAQELADRVSFAIQNALLYRKAEERRIEAEDAAAQLRRVNDELEQFAYIASHDLQEPLRTVASFAQLLERRYREELPQDARDYIAHIVEGARRMSHLIRDLLEYSRVNRSEEPAGQPANMRDVLDASIASLHTAALESGAVITTGEIPIVLRGSAPQLQQLLINLLGNAIKYARPEVPPLIHIQAEREDGMWHFLVRDNGQGFDPAYQERIFGVFRRLQGRDVPGTGIGLALCRRIVERHGGRIWAESTPGAGSRFHFTIPD
jgi:PAS domain S-box-containing protein